MRDPKLAADTGGGRRTRAVNAGRRRAPVVHRLYVRVAWTTLAGLPLLRPRRATAAELQLVALCRRVGVDPLSVRVEPARVRVLLRLHPGQRLTDVVPRLKRGLAEALESAGLPVIWGPGYAASTTSPAAARDAIRAAAAVR